MNLHKYKKRFLMMCAATSLVAMSSGYAQADLVEEILAAESDVEYGEYLAGECSSCHNPNHAVGTSDAVPGIHGAEKKSIVEDLLAYRSGERDNTTMMGVAGSLSNDEIAAIATYLASLTNDTLCVENCSKENITNAEETNTESSTETSAVKEIKKE